LGEVLNPERARGVEVLLQRIAEERQVSVISQNRLALEYLDISLNILLTGRGLGDRDDRS